MRKGDPRRRRLIRNPSPAIAEDMSGKVLGWIYRVLVPLQGYKKFIGKLSFSDDDLAEALGFEEDICSDELNRKEIISRLSYDYSRLDAKPELAESEKTILKNVMRLAEMTGLNSLEVKVLDFAVHLARNELLRDSIDCLGELETEQCFKVVAHLLDERVEDVRKCFSAAGSFSRSGLLAVDNNGKNELYRKLDTLTENLPDKLTIPDVNCIDFLEGLVTKAPKSDLTLADYDHMKINLDVILGHLGNSIKDGRSGVNIYIYGPPGTGKTELSRALGDHFGCSNFEVAIEDSDGDPTKGIHRLRAMRAGQYLLNMSNAIMTFDEAEDIFNDGSVFSQSTAQQHKAWINRALESNKVPIIWLSNSDNLDPAFIRRFDVIVELNQPPRDKRQQVLEKLCIDKVDPENISYLLESDNLPPAVMKRAIEVAHNACGSEGSEKVETAINTLITSTLKCQGFKAPFRVTTNGYGEFDPEMISSTVDPNRLLEGLGKHGSGRLCCYGPPGTGKTAFGRWLSKELDIPIHVKKASDLLGKYVGENEKNIARVFQQAEADGAILLLDEVDSFLRDRRGVDSGWETTLVNEMLTQMESYPGIFIATTNLMDDIDQAALRRFDLKMEFGYLQPNAIERIFRQVTGSLGLKLSGDKDFSVLAGLNNLTPGDFASIVRRSKFDPVDSSAELVELLARECELKGLKGTRPIGFVH